MKTAYGPTFEPGYSRIQRNVDPSTDLLSSFSKEIWVHGVTYICPAVGL